MKLQDRTPIRGFKDFVGFEAEARQILTYEPSIIPGLLQTEEYTRAILRAAYIEGADFDEAVKLRATRQELLSRAEPPVKYTAIIDEAALRRPAGGRRRREVMRGQLERLLELSERSNVAIRVLPFDNGLHPGMNGAFTLIELPHPDDPDIVYVEAGTVGVLLSDHEAVRYYNRVFDGVQQEAFGRERSGEFLHEVLTAY
jgi:hypothetical protein